MSAIFSGTAKLLSLETRAVLTRKNVHGNPVPAFRLYEITGPGKLRNLFYIISLLDDEILKNISAPGLFVLF